MKVKIFTVLAIALVLLRLAGASIGWLMIGCALLPLALAVVVGILAAFAIVVGVIVGIIDRLISGIER